MAIIGNADNTPLQYANRLLYIGEPITFNLAGTGIACISFDAYLNYDVYASLDGSTSFRQNINADSSYYGRSVLCTAPSELLYIGNEAEDTFNLRFNDGDAINRLVIYGIAGLTPYINHTDLSIFSYLSNLTRLEDLSNNSIYDFNLANIVLPTGLTYLHLGQENDTSGNTISGDVVNIPSQLVTFAIGGLNTLDGSLSSIPDTLNTLYLWGQNTVYGDVSILNNKNLTIFAVTGNNTISGDINYYPKDLTMIYIKGLNTLSGNVSNLSSDLEWFTLGGNNTVGGDLINLPSKLYYVDFVSNGTISYSTTGKTWDNSINTFNIDASIGHGLSSASVDNLLIDLANANWDPSDAYITTLYLTGDHGPRTSASDTAYATLLTKVFDVNVT